MQDGVESRRDAVPETERTDALRADIAAGVDDYSAQFRRCAEVGTMVRGNEGFGRKPKKSTLAYLSQWGPIDVHHYDATDDRTIIQSIHETSTILKENRRQRLSGHDGYSPSRELKKVASIPLGDYMLLKKEGVDLFDRNDWPKVCALLDSLKGQKYRTSPGRISHKPLREHIAQRQKR